VRLPVHFKPPRGSAGSHLKGLFCRHDDVILLAFAEQNVFAVKSKSLEVTTR
jgi:hypothetical protein